MAVISSVENSFDHVLKLYWKDRKSYLVCCFPNP